MNTINEVLSPSPLCSGQRQRFLIVSGVYLVLIIAAWRTTGLLERLDGASLWCLPAGLRFCCLLVFGWRGLLLELMTTLAHGLLLPTSSGDSISVFVSAQPLWLLYGWLAPLLAYVAVIFPLRRWMRDPWDFTNPGHSVLFLVAAMAVSMLGRGRYVSSGLLWSHSTDAGSGNPALLVS